MKKANKLTLKIEKDPLKIIKSASEDLLNFHQKAPLAKIGDQLFLGSYEDASNYSKLKEHNIEAIINCSPISCPNVFQSRKEFQYFNFELQDSPSFEISDPLLSIVSLIKKLKEEGLNILIHCYQGVSRAPSIVIGYLITCEKKNLDEALRLVRMNYCKADPNIGFMLQLEQVYLEINGIANNRGRV